MLKTGWILKLYIRQVSTMYQRRVSCLPCRGVSYIHPRYECTGFEFHPFIVDVQEDSLNFVNDSTARDAFEAIPLPKCFV